MIAFVGLGNIGDIYANTKHNVGFWAIDEFSDRNNVSFKAGKGDYVFSKIRSNRALLVKPTTMMNRSGSAVKDVMHRWGLLPSDVIIIFDDVDLPLGTIRIRPKGGDGCHGGLKNIIDQAQTNLLPRIRLGIAESSTITRPSEEYVLRPFNKDSIEEVGVMVRQCADAMQYLITHGLNRTMNEFNS